MAATKTRRKDERAAEVTTGLDWLRLVSIIIAILGIGVASYLSWAEVTGNETQCLDTGSIDCSAVQSSAYSEVMGIPIAVLGLVGYILILGVLILEDQVEILATYGRTAVVGLALFGTIFSAYLSLVEGTVLDAWCQWCVASAVLITVLLILGGVRLRALLTPLRS